MKRFWLAAVMALIAAHAEAAMMAVIDTSIPHRWDDNTPIADLAPIDWTLHWQPREDNGDIFAPVGDGFDITLSNFDPVEFEMLSIDETNGATYGLAWSTFADYLLNTFIDDDHLMTHGETVTSTEGTPNPSNQNYVVLDGSAYPWLRSLVADHIEIDVTRFELDGLGRPTFMMSVKLFADVEIPEPATWLLAATLLAVLVRIRKV